MANFVQLYKSTDLNAPTLSGTAGELTTLLDAVLVNGYTTASVTSIVEASLTYTVTLAVANSTLVVGDKIKFSGASPAGINDVWTIASITSTTIFTFTGPGGLGAITGTILYRKAPLGWTIPSLGGTNPGTNVRVYRSADTDSNRYYLRVDDSNVLAPGASRAFIYGYETMTDINTGDFRFPTASQALAWAISSLVVFKSQGAGSTQRPWQIVGDDKTFYMFTEPNGINNNSFNCHWGFGHYPSYRPGDNYNTMIFGATVISDTQATGSYGLMYINASGTATFSGTTFSPKSTSQVGSSSYIAFWGNVASITHGAFTYPNLADGASWMFPLYIVDSSNNSTLSLTIRGRCPGVYTSASTLQAMGNITHGDQFTGFTGISSHKVICLTSNVNGSVGKIFIDITGPWT